MRLSHSIYMSRVGMGCPVEVTLGWRMVPIAIEMGYIPEFTIIIFWTLQSERGVMQHLSRVSGVKGPTHHCKGSRSTLYININGLDQLVACPMIGQNV